MALRDISKDMGEVYSRLFDHRPVITSEINYMLKEFEEKRHNREQMRLQKSLEHIRELDELLISQAKEVLDKTLSSVIANVVTAVQMSQNVIEREKDEGKERWLQENRSVRVKQWTAFMDHMCEESSKVDQKFDAELAVVQKHYNDIEEKLNISKK